MLVPLVVSLFLAPGMAGADTTYTFINPCGRIPAAQCRQIDSAIVTLEHFHDGVCRRMGSLARVAFADGQIIYDDTSRFARTQVNRAERHTSHALARTMVDEGLILVNPTLFGDDRDRTKSLTNVLAHEVYHLFIGDDSDTTPGPAVDRPGSPAYETGDRCQAPD